MIDIETIASLAGMLSEAMREIQSMKMWGKIQAEKINFLEQRIAELEARNDDQKNRS